MTILGSRFSKHDLLLLILRNVKRLGGFAIARRMTRGDLRILAYHGGSIDDEHRFRPGLFMSGEVFEQRLALLRDQAYPVITLQDALVRREAGTLPPNATVITIDDGWYSTLHTMAPRLRRYGMPAMLYLCTHYVEKQTVVFNVALSYVLTRTTRQTVDLASVFPALTGIVPIATAEQREALAARLWAYGNLLASAELRQSLFLGLSDALGLDGEALTRSRMFGYVSVDEAGTLASYGIDVQLHTHRHRFDECDREHGLAEIERNRAVLSQIVEGERTHFCYPSGEYRPEQIDWLREVGVESSTTVRPGFNRRARPRFELHRFLDSDAYDPLEFEAEMSGFLELCRRAGISV